MLSQNQIITLRIDNLGSSGEGVGSYHGFRVFVDGALPEETVEAKISLVKKSYAIGTIQKILKASPHRIKAPCIYYDRCGGCQLMHLDYQTQLKLKQQRVIDAFERIGGFKNVSVNPCIPSTHEFSYRNKIQLPVQNGIEIGLYEKRSHRLVDIDQCLIHCDLGESIFYHVKRLINGDEKIRHVLIKSAVNKNEALVVFVTGGAPSKELIELAHRLYEASPSVKGVIHNVNREQNNVILGKKYHTLIGSDSIEETLGGLIFKVSPASFFQVNVHQAEALYQYALEQAAISENDVVVDAYCGVGTLSCHLALRAKKVIGIEAIPEAIQDARINAEKNGRFNAEFLCKPVEKALETLEKGHIVVLNPPRKGCMPEVIEALVKNRPNKIIYISCDPATCARDLKLLEYNIQSVQPFDMFPQTAHVETVVMLDRTLKEPYSRGL